MGDQRAAVLRGLSIAGVSTAALCAASLVLVCVCCKAPTARDARRRGVPAPQGARLGAFAALAVSQAVETGLTTARRDGWASYTHNWAVGVESAALAAFSVVTVSAGASPAVACAAVFDHGVSGLPNTRRPANRIKTGDASHHRASAVRASGGAAADVPAEPHAVRAASCARHCRDGRRRPDGPSRVSALP